MRKTSFAAVFLGVSCTALAQAPRVGAEFPILPFPTLDGTQRKSIADFRGKRTLLIQFASW